MTNHLEIVEVERGFALRPKSWPFGEIGHEPEGPTCDRLACADDSGVDDAAPIDPAALVDPEALSDEDLDSRPSTADQLEVDPRSPLVSPEVSEVILRN